MKRMRVGIIVFLVLLALAQAGSAGATTTEPEVHLKALDCEHIWFGVVNPEGGSPVTTTLSLYLDGALVWQETDTVPAHWSWVPDLTWAGLGVDLGYDEHDVTVVATGIGEVSGSFGPCDEPPGGQGCTPGYWKNHLESWEPTGYSPGDDFDATFGVDLFSPDITLNQAVRAKGGGANRLARHGTAALLSAAHPDVAYGYTVAEVIALVQAGDAGALEAANEQFCPLD